jgi:peroxiredoxin
VCFTSDLWTNWSNITDANEEQAMSPTIQEQSEQVQAAAAERLPAEVLATFTHDRKAMLERGMPADAVAPGDLLQDFTLPNATGTDVSLSQLVAGGPAVLVFYRGGWCPYCNLELRAYQKILLDIEELGARLVAVSPETPDNTLTTAQKNELTFFVLSDTNGALADALGIRFPLSEPVKAYFRKAGHDLPSRNGDGGWSLPIPATYVVGRGGRIALAHVEPDYRKRLEPQAILDVLRQLAAAS